MAIPADVPAWAKEQASGPLPHFWPRNVVIALYERRIHGQSLPRASRAKGGTVADFWLTEIGLFLFDYFLDRHQDVPHGVLIRSGFYQTGQQWTDFIHVPKKLLSTPVLNKFFPQQEHEMAAGEYYQPYVGMVHNSRVLRQWTHIMTFLDPADYENILIPREYHDNASRSQPSAEDVRASMAQVMSL